MGKSLSKWLLLGSVCAVTGLGCGRTIPYIYRPTEHVQAQVNGLPSAKYDVPPEAPTGDVLVTVLGFEEHNVENTRAKLETMQVRMVVRNNSDETPWTVTPQSQVAFIGAAQITPMWARADAPQAASYSIPKGSQRILDLYFPVPTTMRGASDLPRVELMWQVQTAARAFAERTPFEAIQIDTDPGYGYGYGHPGYGYRSHVSVGIGVGSPYYGYPYPYYGAYDPFWYGRPQYFYSRPHFYGGYGGGYGGGFGGYRGGGFSAPGPVHVSPPVHVAPPVSR